MKVLLTATALSLLTFAPATAITADDENHKIIEKVMVDGLKGDDSPLAKVLDEKASKKEIGDLAKLIKTMDGTKTPVGAQDAYDKKVAELIAAMDAIAGGADTPEAFNRLDEASNCKACHTDHKPKKK